ncbi:MAG TPA: heavy metal translocating P-type ATPase [Gaiellaceae bacterium]|nr:heavy metal translocating P-type ATPase [Gaiellaceae bacterium]
MIRRLLALQALLALAAGGVLHGLDRPGLGDLVWAGSTALMLVPLTWSVARTLLRRDVGVDAIALVAIATALALGEYLAGAVVALMLAGGNALEAYAARRARRELTSLVERQPRVAHRLRAGAIEEVPLADVVPGDAILVRAGEIVPVDGVVAGEEAALDEAALTGEPLPRTARRGEPVHSGTANAGDAFELRAVRPASESTYAALVRLVEQAGRRRARFERLADQYAAFFLPVTLATAGGAWALSGDPVRALAVLVIATPCPLILAAPIAFVAGVSRAARAGVIVKGAAAIEQLGRARTVLLDKTGTLTVGTPRVERVARFDGRGEAELLRLAASLDQLSAHPLAEALVREAAARGLGLSFPSRVEERPGHGIEGDVDGRRVTVGDAIWLAERGYAGADATPLADEGRVTVLVGVDGRLSGALVLADRLRDDARAAVDELRGAGIAHIAMVTGDRRAVGEEIGRALGVDRVYAERTPEDKLEVVRAVQRQPGLRPVVMVGDGVNDAPALALADVGIAMGSAGATVSSETADAVIVVDRIDRVAHAVRIGRRSLGIARQSVIAGMALSFVGMALAALGHITPVAGALIQEAIDVAVILNSLRALR